MCASMVAIMQSQLAQAWVIIKTAFQRNFTYRFTVMMYRLGEIAEVLVLIFMWTAVYASTGGTIKGFTLQEMITYVLAGNLCFAIVRNFLPSYVSEMINSGRLSMFLVKPIPFIKYIFINELGRTFLATAISIITQVAIIYFFLDKIIINTDPRYLGLMLVMVFFAFVIELLIGFLIGTVAFWTEEVEGLLTSIDRIKRFFSGGYFPLSLLPTAALSIGSYLPFAYSFFIPASLYLKKITLLQGVHGILVQVVWIAVLSVILSIVWKRGLRRYEATGS